MRIRLPGLLLLAACLALPAMAQETPVFRMTLKNHRFEPDRLTVPAGIKFILMVRNADDTPAEFESPELGAEKIISAGREATIRLGPLQPGEYKITDDFHQDTGKAVLVASGN